jgi:hypothetical protein
VIPNEAHARIGALATANDASTIWMIWQAVLKFLEAHGDQAGRLLRLVSPRRRAVSGRAVSQKIARQLAGEYPRVQDLFPCCDRQSRGFKAAGIELRTAVESDPAAARGHWWSCGFRTATLRLGTSALEILAPLKPVVTAAPGP